MKIQHLAQYGNRVPHVADTVSGPIYGWLRVFVFKQGGTTRVASQKAEIVLDKYGIDGIKRMQTYPDDFISAMLPERYTIYQRRGYEDPTD